MEGVDIVDRRGIRIDDDVVDQLESREIYRAQFLRHMRAIFALGDMPVGGNADDQNIRLALGEKQMPHMSRVNDVENAVTHDDFLGARKRSQNHTEFLGGLDLVPIPFRKF